MAVGGMRDERTDRQNDGRTMVQLSVSSCRLQIRSHVAVVGCV